MVAAQSCWLLLSTAAIVQTVTLTDLANAHLFGVDTLGTAIVEFIVGADHDSATISLVARRLGTKGAMIRKASSAEPGYPPHPRAEASGRTTYSQGAWHGSEVALLFADGWIAIARYRPYRVNWRAPDGKWTLGKALHTEGVAVTKRDKLAYMKRAATKSGTAPKSPATFPLWPKFIPPFVGNGAVLATPDGKLLIPRTPTADHPEALYDAVNRMEQSSVESPLERPIAFWDSVRSQRTCARPMTMVLSESRVIRGRDSIFSPTGIRHWPAHSRAYPICQRSTVFSRMKAGNFQSAICRLAPQVAVWSNTT